MNKIVDPMDLDSKAMATNAGKHLTFTLADETYGVGILKVKEIIGMMPVTSVPRTPEFIKGVINLRGKVIPVVDLRLKFSMEAIPYTERTCIIVMEIDSDDVSAQCAKFICNVISKIYYLTQYFLLLLIHR